MCRPPPKPKSPPVFWDTDPATLQQMEVQGLVKRTDREDLAIAYKPVTPKRRVLGPVLKRLVQHALSRRPVEVVQRFMQDCDTAHPTSWPGCAS